MNRMIVANLVHRPIRSLISVIAIGVEVTLILVIVSFSLGMLNDAKQRQEGIGADVIVQPPSSSFLADQGGGRSAEVAARAGGGAGSDATQYDRKCGSD